MTTADQRQAVLNTFVYDKKQLCIRFDVFTDGMAYFEVQRDSSNLI